jgi:hypothetical protein
MTVIRAHYDGKSFVPDEPVILPPHQLVTLHVDPLASRPLPSLAAKEEKVRLLEQIEQLAIACDAPEADFSRDSIYSGNLDDTR